jgi:MGT family glycosyltransferase
MPLSAPSIPPYGMGLRPAAGRPGRLRDAALRPVLGRAYRSATLPAFNAVRASVGVAPYTTTDDLFTGPPLVLYMTAEPLEYPRPHWPESVLMVGPCSWDPPAAPPPWLADVGRPLVLVSTSSEFQDDGALVRTALDALAGEDVDVVATLPSAELTGPVPANARVERFVPHGPILARAACAVTHGGAGVTQKALAAGVPVCVVPFGRDQFEVARRVEVAGAGTRLPASRLTPERLRSAVLEAMSMRAGARRVAEGFAATGGAVRAADAVAALAAAVRAAPRAAPA